MGRPFFAALAAIIIGVAVFVLVLSASHKTDHAYFRALSKPPRFLISQMPIPTAIISAYGRRRHPIFHRTILHQGLDFRAAPGQFVRCVLDGVVVHAGKRGGFGNAVYVRHPVGGKTSVYAHLIQVDVKLGQRVKQGQLVGRAGSTGYATGVHLHFGVKTALGKWIDPVEFLRKVPGYQLIAWKQRLPQNTLIAADSNRVSGAIP